MFSLKTQQIRLSCRNHEYHFFNNFYAFGNILQTYINIPILKKKITFIYCIKIKTKNITSLRNIYKFNVN